MLDPAVPRRSVAPILTLALSLAAATAGAQPPTFQKSFQPATIGSGSVSTLGFTIANPDPVDPVSDLAFTDVLPGGVTIATPAGAASTCTGTLSAPDGGTTISFSDGALGAGASCTIQVNVTSASAGTHSNVSGDLTSSAGNSGNATADLTVATDRPGFSKSFAPASVGLGGRSTLTFTIDNTANPAAAFHLTFTDSLPIGVVLADPPNASTDCVGGVITATPGTGVVAYGPAFPGDASVAANSSCMLAVDVIGGARGVRVNTSGELTSTAGGPVRTSGRATASLTVTADTVTLVKSFPDDPVVPGGTVTLRFTVFNFDRDFAATDIAFTDDVDATLSGLTAVGLPPAGACGPGSVVAGAGLVSLSGGSLPAEGSCTFDVTLQVPAAATPGGYPNVTSAITAQLDGTPFVGAPAAETLFVDVAPLLTKTFLTDPVGAGEIATVEFTITNTSTGSPATDIAFMDNLTAFLPGATVAMLPAGGFCGAGSAMSTVAIAGELILNMTGGNLPAAGSCTFTVDLQLPVGAPPGPYVNTTDEITATIEGTTRFGGSATDTLTVVGGPALTKQFTDDPVLPGDTVTLEFTISNDAEGAEDATDIAFSDDLGAVLTGLAAVPPLPVDPCGTGSVLGGTTTLTLTGGSLTAGTSCTFSVTLQVPAGAVPGSYPNTTSEITATVGGTTVAEAPASDALQIAGLSLAKSFTDDPVIPGGTVTLEFTLTNSSPVSDATNITFTDNLGAVLPGLAAVPPLPMTPCGAGSQITGTNLLSFTGGNLVAGTSCTFAVTVQVPGGTPSDTYVNTTSSLVADVDGSPVVLDAATDLLVVTSDLLALTKEFTDDPVLPGGTVTLEFTVTNLHASGTATGIGFNDDLGAALPGLVAVGLPAMNVCGAGSEIAGTGVIVLTDGELGPGASCTFQVTLQVPGGAPAGSFTNTTSAPVGTITGLAVNGTPASDVLGVVSLTFAKAFDGPSVAGGTATLSFTIDNLDAAAGVTGLAFLDGLDTVLPGLAAVGLPAAGVCGPGSTLTGTSTLALSGGNLGPGASCTFDVTLQLPPAAAPGSYLNVTSDLLLGGLVASPPATATLGVEPPPAFAKSFAPATIATGGVSRLTFTIDNAASALAASSLDFTDDLPAGVVLASPASPAVTCSGGNLTADPGTGTIAYTGGSVAAGASCTVAVDVTSDVEGAHVNVSGPLTSSSGASGTATATLTVFEEEIGLAKSFVVNPVLRGGTVIAEYTVSLASTQFAATAIAFTDDLDAAVPGLAAVDTPLADVCGPGSLLSGTSVLTLTGGNLPPGGSCTFQATLVVPPDAPLGVFPSPTGGLTALVGGNPVTGAPASADLEIVFLDFSKQFEPDAVSPGGTVSLSFTIANPDPVNAATGIGFTDDLDAVLPGLAALDTPLADVCGPGSILDGGSLLTLTGGNLGPGASCTFAVTVQVPPNAVGGSYPNLTSVLAALVGGEPVEGDPAGAAAASLGVGGNLLEIPTLAGWGLLLLAALLATAAVARLRSSG